MAKAWAWSVSPNDTIAGLGASLGRKIVRGELAIDDSVHAPQTFEFIMADGRRFVGHLRMVLCVDILREIHEVDAAPPPRED